MDWEHSILCRQEVERLLGCENDEQDARDDEESDCLSTSPGVGPSSEINGHDAGDESSTL